jgi:HEAT repeat protein
MDRDMTVRIGAAEVLGKLGDHRAIQPLISLLGDPFSDVRTAAQAAIRKITVK